MRIKLSNKVRPEFRKLLKDCGSLKAAAELCGTTPKNISMMKFRGYMSVFCADTAERRSKGKYKARLLIRLGD